MHELGRQLMAELFYAEPSRSKILLSRKWASNYLLLVCQYFFFFPYIYDRGDSQPTGYSGMHFESKSGENEKKIVDVLLDCTARKVHADV